MGCCGTGVGNEERLEEWVCKVRGVGRIYASGVRWASGS